MRIQRIVATVLCSGVVVGLTVVGRGQDPSRAPKVLEPRSVAVRVLLGVGDGQEQTWGGKAALDQGEIVGIDGWRFRQGDRITGPASWDSSSHLTTAGKKAANKNSGAAKNKKGAAKNKKGAAKTNKKAARTAVQVPQGEIKKPAGANQGGQQAIAASGVFLTLKAPEEARLTITTARGEFTVALADLAAGSPRRYLDGQAEVQAVPPSALLFNSDDQDDFPAAVADGKGGAWVAFVSHQARGPVLVNALTERPKNFADYVAKGGGDQVRLIHFDGSKAGNPIDVTEPGVDAWRPAIALAGDGQVLVVWSENRDGNFDLYRRRYDPGRSAWSPAERLTNDAGADTDAVLATAPDGKVWMAWQAWREGQADILLARADDAGAPQVQAISQGPGNQWSPALAIDKGGAIHVAYDGYQAGDYDVWLRTRAPDGTLGAVVAVAGSPAFEARPSLAVDSSGGVWVAYEERTRDWGKDAENLVDGQGSTLYRASAVRVRCLEGGRRFDAPDPIADAPAPLRTMNSFPRLAADRTGRVWLSYRHRHDPRNNGVGGAWVSVVSMLSGAGWSSPAVLAQSDGMLDNRLAFAIPADGPALAFYSGDGRLSRDANVVESGLFVAALSAPSRAAGEPVLSAVTADDASKGPAIHPDEAADVARMRTHRVQAGGKIYRLLRGEFHRHTEISGDGGNDGALEDMWRYALDAARLDWIGNGDHDNGGGKEYTWWITQKTTDLYHNPPGFTPMFTYERSVQYPHGHRNVMWAKRGVRTLPRLSAAEGGVSDDDTKMLYTYLKELGGICASHTSATAVMGTDWRDNDPTAEPIVEIFQGHRNSYEYFGAPRVGRTAAEAIAGMQPYGMIWNALAMQYKLGFQASSDHISTHISFAIAIAEDQTRASILDAFQRRHCYAATDNILLDVKSGDHLMGDEFEAEGPVRLKILAHGTRPIARVDVIKDFVHVYTTEPKKVRVEFEWTDEEKRPAGLSWYYVRVMQDDGELAWGSPFWVRQSVQ